MLSESLVSPAVPSAERAATLHGKSQVGFPLTFGEGLAMAKTFCVAQGINSAQSRFKQARA